MMKKYLSVFLCGLFLLLVCLKEGQAAPVSVQLGIDRIDEYQSLFAGRRVALITNATGINSQWRSSAAVLAEKTNLVAIWAPEHGFRSQVAAGEKTGNMTDSSSGLTVYSLYGDTRRPSADMLAEVDLVAFDIQDIGTRHYTYVSTMVYAMQACAEAGKRFVVLDRPNPIGGAVEGPVLRPGLVSFIGLYPIPLRHGMTVGELARYYNAVYHIGADLQVVPLKGWKRSLFVEETTVPWVMTSPNIPTPASALAYAATGIFGGTNFSEGVGTTLPFELAGAPWIDGEQLASLMNNRHLPGVLFRPIWFTPQFGRYKDTPCGGVQLHILDKHAFEAVRTGAALFETMRDLSSGQLTYTPSGEQFMLDKLQGDPALRLGQESLDDLLLKWQKECLAFRQAAKPYLLYEE